ncbi:bone morphogenetic protein 10-like [Scyliorhinus canicula]|uniref:bone morphogenetic protein 10-like n=1 Tax=Scyliorhinus canicula TaxID=7830 RepID=UPI0018F65160|nr:bone morphogenetic protein 10-like [Scyliorhinus canicula]
MSSYTLQLFACLCTVLPWTASYPIDNRAGEQGGDTYLLQHPGQQQDLSSLLTRNHSARTLNGSDSLELAPSKVEPPQYMMELYNRFATDRTSIPSSNIVRSFKNEDVSVSNQTHGVRTHSLLFNVSVPHHEEITMAELRLYTLLDTDRRIYKGVDRKVTIYQVDELQSGEIGDHSGLVKLAKRRIYGKDSGWETFDVTEAIVSWSKSEETTHRLQVHIENMEEQNFEDANLDIDMKPETKHEPLLIVFSDDRNSMKNEAIEELEQMIDHEQDVTFHDVEAGNDGINLNEETLLQRRSNMLYDTSSRIRRNAKISFCKRTPLYVEFKEIKWDSWIIAPKGYEAYECKGSCNYPLTEQVTPTKHAIVQTLLNLHNPNMAAKACCVPTKLNPISILYLDDAGVVTYKFKYEGMVVAECGCR